MIKTALIWMLISSSYGASHVTYGIHSVVAQFKDLNQCQHVAKFLDNSRCIQAEVIIP